MCLLIDKQAHWQHGEYAGSSLEADLHEHLLVLGAYVHQNGAVAAYCGLWDWHVLLHDFSCLSLGDLLGQSRFWSDLPIGRRLQTAIIDMNTYCKEIANCCTAESVHLSVDVHTPTTHMK